MYQREMERDRLDDDGRKQAATIEAKPQIKNVGGDVTRFMPTSLRIKREARDTKGRLLRPSGKAKVTCHLMSSYVIRSMGIRCHEFSIFSVYAVNENSSCCFLINCIYILTVRKLIIKLNKLLVTVLNILFDSLTVEEE